MSAVCCQVEVSATSRSLIQRSPTDCDASLCVIKKTSRLRLRPALGGSATKKKKTKRCKCYDLYTSSQLYMYRASFRPSSGAYHCSYSFWYCPPMLLLAGVALQPTISAGERPQTYALDRAATGTGILLVINCNYTAHIVKAVWKLY